MAFAGIGGVSTGDVACFAGASSAGVWAAGIACFAGAAGCAASAGTG